jgi:hypothetical protein
LTCRFTQGDAFRPGLAVKDGACSIVISSGLMHHLPESGLVDFSQRSPGSASRGSRTGISRPACGQPSGHGSFTMRACVSRSPATTACCPPAAPIPRRYSRRQREPGRLGTTSRCMRALTGILARWTCCGR